MGSLSTETNSGALRLDEEDPLKEYRAQFHVPKFNKDTEFIYLCGNSLGLQPKHTKVLVQHELDRWAEEGVEGQLDGEEPWVTYEEILVPSMAKIVGALDTEIGIMNSLTVNLHLMLTAFYNPTPKRNKIIALASAFPSDVLAFKSQIEMKGYNPEEALVFVGPRKGEKVVREEDIIERMGDDVALVVLEGVHYLTGQLLNIPLLAKSAQEKGILFGLDLAHAAGNVELSLHDWGVDFAVWCTYKYLNSGPGGIGGCFIHERHAENLEQKRLRGWWGYERKTRFLMDPSHPPRKGALGFAISDPPLLALAALRASLQVYDKVGMKAFREKSLRLTGYLEEQLKAEIGEEVQLTTPSDSSKRGCQLSLTFPSENAQKILCNLKEHGVICDFRRPNCIRVAPNPLYNNFQDVYNFVQILKRLLLA